MSYTNGLARHVLESDALFLLGLCSTLCAGQVTGNEAPEMEVDEKSFLPTAPKNADAADETESWCVSFLPERHCIYAQLCSCLCQCTTASVLFLSPGT